MPSPIRDHQRVFKLGMNVEDDKTGRLLQVVEINENYVVCEDEKTRRYTYGPKLALSNLIIRE